MRLHLQNLNKRAKFVLIVTYLLPQPSLFKAAYTHDHDTLVLPETRIIDIPRPRTRILSSWSITIYSKEAKSVIAFDLFPFFRTDLIQSEASCKPSSTSDWLMSAKNVS